MFKILGADGKEYGPVLAAQIVQWIREGRANHETMVQRQGEFDWKPLAQLAEFADALGIKPPVVAAAPGAPAVPPMAAGAPVAVMPAAGAQPAFDARVVAVQKAGPPAIGLMITGGLGLAMNLLSLVIHLVRTTQPPPPPGIPPEIAQIIEMMNGPLGLVLTLVGIVVSVLVLFGGIQMQRLRSRGFALTAAIIAIVPCTSPCCLIGIPIGIWALVILAKPEVRSQFE